MRTYSYTTCRICNKTISSNGLAKTQHYRKHVRDGLATETKDRDGYLVFIRKKEAVKK